jgi:hypothetical protein
MHLSPPPILYPDLRLEINKRLQKVIDLLKNNEQETELYNLKVKNQPSQWTMFDLDAVPLSRLKDLAQVGYASAIAIKLASGCNQTAMDLAQAIVTQFYADIPEDNIREFTWERNWKHLTTIIKPPGLIVFQVTDRGVAMWLQALTNRHFCLDKNVQWSHDFKSNCKQDNYFHQNSTSLLEIQYAHARCCTLLRMGVQAKLMVRSDSRIIDSSLEGDIIQPDPFPWLTANAFLRLQHPFERQLIGQLFVTLDELSTEGRPASSAIQPWKLCKSAHVLSQRVVAFHAACGIYGDLSTKDISLAQARLGLVLASQRVLCSILQHWIGAAAPTEL